MSQPSRSATPPPADSQPRIADAPFHDQENGADVILRTSDGVDFYTHKTILCLVSPFFKTMFRLPQPADSAGSLPVVDVPESSHILDIILRSSYPFGSPTFRGLDDIEQVLEAALKYDIDSMVSVAKRYLDSFLDKYSLRIFVLGCRLNHEGICQSAATTLLKHPLQSLDSEVLRRISGYQYHILTQWHSRCCTVASNAVSTRYWFRPCDVLSKTANCDCGSCWVQDPMLRGWYAPTRVWEYLEDARNAVASCPSSTAILHGGILGPQRKWSTGGCASTTARTDHRAGARYLSVSLLGPAVDQAVAEIPMPKFYRIHSLEQMLYLCIVWSTNFERYAPTMTPSKHRHITRSHALERPPINSDILDRPQALRIPFDLGVILRICNILTGNVYNVKKGTSSRFSGFYPRGGLRVLKTNSPRRHLPLPALSPPHIFLALFALLLALHPPTMADSSIPSAPPQPSPAEEIQPRPADTPFDKQENGADLTLRTSDKVDFYAHRLFLSFASPVFKNMFALPQFTADPAGQPTIIDVPEDSQTIDFILRSCYPIASTPLTRLADVRRVLEAVFKYQMDAVLREVGFSLKEVVDEDPLGVFIIAWRCDREDVCRVAAIRMLQCHFPSLESSELRNLPAYHYRELMQWHARCCTAASNVPSTKNWLQTTNVLAQPPPCSNSACWVRNSCGWYAPNCLWEYLERAKAALLSRPSSVAITSDDVVRSKDLWQAGRCHYSCKTNAINFPEAGRDFSVLLGREVDRVVSEVRSSVLLSAYLRPTHQHLFL
ncbi:hypothetical protein EVG20_g3388 [Dentipellis fragilis]|uniref:BTB domain-containing protein n=1 Tax=Dentipellis fragilis TaxID=205917 RepID=A0A4Y9Z491_9AGAM|nr:hypothetical protein EVG20_g3388 [Dentipellis fragilis]